MTTALILAAGKATRLTNIRDQHAKANVPVADTTPLRFALESLRRANVNRVWINTHYKAEQVRQQALHYGSDLELNFLHESKLLGTGGTLLEVCQRDFTIPDVILNAKVFGDFNLASLIDEPAGSLMLHPKTDATLFGGLTYSPNMSINGLSAKGEQLPNDSECAVFTGICTPHPLWVEHLQRNRKSHPDALLCLIRHGLIPALGQTPGHARAVLHRGDWCEISTPQRVQAAANWVREHGLSVSQTGIRIS
jgi:NDP-sugar pyrophosphorylase family protein